MTYLSIKNSFTMYSLKEGLMTCTITSFDKMKGVL